METGLIKNHQITFSYASLLGGDILYAVNSQHNFVAQCEFEIISVYTRKLTKSELQKIEPPFTHLVKDGELEYKIKNKNRLLMSSRIKENKFYSPAGKVFDFKENYCWLSRIFITDDNYYKVGVGSKLIQEVENYARAANCDYIKGCFSPFGRFEAGARDFYIRNNFEFVKDSNGYTSYIIKDLQK